LFSRILNTFGTKSLTAVINLLIAVLLSQYLGPAGKGVQSLIITTITFILVFANLVGGATLVYLAPRHEASRLVIPSYFWTLITSFVAYGILWFFPIIDKAYILHACVLSVLNSVASVHTSLLIGKEKIKTANFVGLVQPAALIISLGIYFMLFGKATVDTYIQSLYISFSLSLIASIFWFVKFCGPFRLYPVSYYWDLSKEMVQYGLLNQVAHVTQMLSFRLSYYVLDHFRGEAAVGVYSNGISLAESIWLIAKSISLVQYARIANLQDRQQAAEFTVKLIKVSVAMSLIILLPLLLLPSDFYVFLFGKGFEGTKMVILTLAVGVLVYNYSILIGHYFSGTGRYWVNAVTSSIGLVASIALYYSLIPLYGQIGAGLATSISYIITSLIFIIWFAREYKKWHLMIFPTREDILSLRMEVRKLFDK
jgi:O-antigen/teichoic acid export membrane protein